MSLEVGLNANEFDYLYSSFDSDLRNNTLDVSNVDELTYMADGAVDVVPNRPRPRNPRTISPTILPSRPRPIIRPLPVGTVPRPVVTGVPRPINNIAPIGTRPHFPRFPIGLGSPRPILGGFGVPVAIVSPSTILTVEEPATKPTATTGGGGGGGATGGGGGGSEAEAEAETGVEKTAEAPKKNIWLWLLLGTGVVVVYYAIKK